MFEEIDKVKVSLPKSKNVVNDIQRHKFNTYQIITFVIGGICFILGIVFGNAFPACGQSSTFYADACVTTEFNLFLTFTIWFISFILCMFLYGIGEIIRLLGKK